MAPDASVGEDVKAALEAAGDIAYFWDLDSDRLQVAGPAESLFGAHRGDWPATAVQLAQRIHPDDVAVRQRAVADHLEAGAPLDCEYRLRKPQQGFVAVHERGTARHDAAGRATAVAGVLRIVDARRRREFAAGSLVNYDSLTGLFNRVRLRDALDHALASAREAGRQGGFLRIGIDGLSGLNEAYGEAVGNDIVVGVAHRIETVTQTTDVLGRVGGDHFGAIRAACDGAELVALGDRMVAAVRDRAVETAVGDIPVSVSVGAVLFPDYVKTPFGVFDLAARGLQAAKRAGPGGVQLYRPSPEERQRHEESLQVGERVRAALAADRLRLAYQPVVWASTAAPAFYEGLLRLLDTDNELVRAAGFVPVVEALGMNRAVDERALEMAVQALAQVPDAELAINVSAFTIDDRSWLRRLASLVRPQPALARRLIVEITETAVMNDIGESSRHIAAVRELGCRVALDDFGAGYTSFRELKSLDVDLVKIDGQFVRNVAADADNQLFITTLLNVAQSFGLATVAECVESAADAQKLAELGVDLLQGSQFGLPAAELGPSAAPVATASGSA